MSQQNGVAKTPAPTQQAAARPYRRFIVPSMHRRFTNAALVSLGFCGVQALWMGQLTSFWQMIGITTIRTLLLFISILAIYVLRVANLHVGERTTASAYHSLYNLVFSFNAARAVLWYSFSAVFFCEVYIWSAAANARLSIIDPGKSWEPQRLNERPIFLRTMFLCLAVAQSSRHLYKDYDRASIPTVKPPTTAEAIVAKSQRAFWVPLLELKQNIFPIVRQSFFWAFVTTFAAPFLYWLFIRQSVWSWTYTFAKYVFKLSKSSKPPTFPTLVVDLLGRFLVEGFILMLSWELANSAFDAYLSLEPLKQGRLLTDESQDPNGSLLNGLKTTRPIPRSFAFWELVLVAEYMSTRRQAVYSEINRQGGATWSQILTVCLGELHAIVKRIQTFQTPPLAATALQQQQNEARQLHTLPRIAAPVKQDNIIKHSPTSTPSKAYTQTTQAPSPQSEKLLASSATKLLTYTTDATLSKQHQHSLSKDGITGTAQSLALWFLRLPLGAPFRQTFARRACSVVFTTPHGNLGTVGDAVTAVSRLVVLSKKEDNFGCVYRDVPSIVRTFASTHNVVEGFVKTLDVHWTDVGFAAGAAGRGPAGGEAAASSRKVEDIEVVLAALRAGLRDIVNEFGEYSDDLGLSAGEMRTAKEIAAKGVQEEMRSIAR